MISFEKKIGFETYTRIKNKINDIVRLTSDRTADSNYGTVETENITADSNDGTDVKFHSTADSVNSTA